MKYMRTIIHVFEDGRTVYGFVMKKDWKKAVKEYKEEFKTEMLGKTAMVVYH